MQVWGEGDDYLRPPHILTLSLSPSPSSSVCGLKKDTASPLPIGLASLHLRQERRGGQRGWGEMEKEEVRKVEAGWSRALLRERPETLQSQLNSAVCQPIFNGD